MKYSSGQPRVPAGEPGAGEWTSEGGVASSGTSEVLSDATPDNTWIPGAQYAGGLRCEGFSAGCQSGGSYGTTATYNVFNRNLCMDCAVKMLGIQNEPSNVKVLKLSPYLIDK